MESHGLCPGPQSCLSPWLTVCLGAKHGLSGLGFPVGGRTFTVVGGGHFVGLTREQSWGSAWLVPHPLQNYGDSPAARAEPCSSPSLWGSPHPRTADRG